MLEDLADLFEQSCGERNPDPGDRRGGPVEFAETFLQNYPEGQWINKERKRLTEAIESVTKEEVP